MKMKRYTNHYDMAKMVIALFIVLVAFGIFLFLNSYNDVIYEEMNPNTFYIFATLATVASGLLIGLLYVVSNSKNNKEKRSSVRSAKKAKKVRK
jgi:tetrahydromethanopterin S-methyltransferase subunit E